MNHPSPSALIAHAPSHATSSAHDSKHPAEKPGAFSSALAHQLAQPTTHPAAHPASNQPGHPVGHPVAHAMPQAHPIPIHIQPHTATPQALAHAAQPIPLHVTPHVPSNGQGTRGTLHPSAQGIALKSALVHGAPKLDARVPTRAQAAQHAKALHAEPQDSAAAKVPTDHSTPVVPSPSSKSAGAAPLLPRSSEAPTTMNLPRANAPAAASLSHPAIVSSVAEDASLRVALLGRSAHVSMDTPDAGALHVHLRIRDQVTDVKMTGAAAASLSGHERELSHALSAEGLSLGSLSLSNGGAQQQGQPDRSGTPDRDPDDSPRSQTPRAASSSTATPAAASSIHVKA